MTDEQLTKASRYFGVLLADLVLDGEIDPLSGDQVSSIIAAYLASIGLAEDRPEDWSFSPYFEEAANAYNQTLIAAVVANGLDGREENKDG